MATTDFQSCLINVEEDFVNSITEGLSSLQSFEQSWSTLASTIAATGETLDTNTSQLAHAVAHRIEALATSLLNFHNESSSFNSTVMTELDDMLRQLTLEDALTPPSKSIHTSAVCPPYIPSAYKWLLGNIHNPYPSKETKNLIARGTGTSVQNIDTWFLNVRRRIGWTSICKRFFSGSKSDAVVAAQRALIEDNYISTKAEDQPLSANIRMAFVQMEATAKELYADKFTKSSLAGKLDGMVRDMSYGDRNRREKARAKERGEMKRKQSTDKLNRKLVEEEVKWKEALLMSSTPTRITSPTASDASNEDEPLPIASKKRRLVRDVCVGVETLSSRPMKRSRFSSTARPHSPTESLTSSRASSCTPSLSDDDPKTPPLSKYDPTTFPREKTLPGDAHLILPSQSAARKRRLSEAGANPAPKRQMFVRPRPHVVSDPLPKLTYSNPFISSPSSAASSVVPSPLFEAASFPDSEWSSLFFDTPGTVVLDDLDLSVLREPEFSCIAETAALLNVNRESNDFMNKDSDPSTIHPNFFDVLSYDDTDSLFGSRHAAWPYDNATPLSPSTPSKPESQVDHARKQLTSLDDFSLSSLPMNQYTTLCSAPTSDAVPLDPSEVTLNNVEPIDWFSIIPQPHSSAGFASNTMFTTVISETPQLLPATETVDAPGLPAVSSNYPISATPLNITSEARAEKYRQYRELLTKAKQLEVELGRS